MGLKLKSLARAVLQIAGTVAVIKPSLVPIVQNLETTVQLGGALAASIGIILGQINAKKTNQ
jgi:hypothetical protein